MNKLLPTHLLLGKKGEELAIDFLQKKHFKILCTNFPSKYGEIDIIAQDKKTLVFVEVKTRSNDETVDPSLAVTSAKIDRIFQTGQVYMQKYHIEADFRCDVITILPDSIEYYENVSLDW